MRAYERLLAYAQFDTASDAASETCPSTASQLVLAKALTEEMTALGIEDVRLDENGYVYGCIPANTEGRLVMGLIAHMDTVDDVPVLPMHTRIVENYDGGKVRLDNGDVLDPDLFPVVKKVKGKSLIVTDGNTLLGGDDKAGIAEILTMAETLRDHPEIRHGKIMIGFTPDEEIGRGADLFDVEGFGAEFAYTVDGGAVNEVEYENFNAASGEVIVHGLSVHPGAAKNIMRNASLYAMEFNAMLPAEQIPAFTCGYEGFYHLCSMEGSAELARLEYIIRDHDAAKFEEKKAAFARIGEFLNAKYGAGTFEVKITDSYRNMREIIEKNPQVLERARKAITLAGMQPASVAIRGGTDGCRLSYMGLPCPNLGTGCMNGHGRFECACVEDMDTMVNVLVHLVSLEL